MSCPEERAEQEVDTIVQCLVSVNFNSAWPRFEDGRWGRQAPALQAWGRLLLVPGGIEAWANACFTVEAERARQTDRNVLDSIKLGKGKRWLQDPRCQFFVAMELADAFSTL